MKTLATLREEVLSWMDEAGTTGTSATLVDYVLNQANAQRATQQRWPWMKSSKKTFTTVVGQTEYVLPETGYKLDYLYNKNTCQFIGEISDEQIVARGDGNGEATSAYAQFFQKAGLSPIRTYIAAPDTLALTSTVGEASGHYLSITGEDSTGEELTETLAPGASTSNTFARITRIDKIGTSWAGTITLATTGGTTLLVLTASQPGKQYLVIRLLETPSAVETIEYRFIRAPRVMSNDNDLPDVPWPDSQILVWDALILLAAYSEVDSEATNVWRQSQTVCELTMLTSVLQGDTTGSWSESVRDLSGSW